MVAGAILILAPAAFSQPTPPPATPDPAPVATAKARADAAAAQAAKLRAELPQGPVEVKVEQGLVTVTADQAWKMKILHEIGAQVGFTAVGGGGSSHKPVTIRFERVPLEEAIRRICDTDPYWVGYEFEPATKSYAVRNVFVGAKGLRAATALRMSEMAKRAKAKREQEAKERAPGAPKRGRGQRALGVDAPEPEPATR